MQDFSSGTSIRGNKTDRLGVFVAPFPISGSSPSDDDDMTVKQPPCRQDAILFLLCVHQTIILSRKHLFLIHFCHCLWGTWSKNVEQNRLWLYQNFIFEILYWIMYISNNAIILPVCNIRVEICLYIIIALPRVILFSIPSSLFLTWCSYIKYLSKLKTEVL